MTSKIAVILRGPPAIGKSSVRERLLLRLGIAKDSFVDLDARGRRDRVRQKESHAFLVLELAYGEAGPPIPANAPPGATRNPKEWVDVLAAQGRETYSFLIWADWPEAERRIRMKWRGESDGYRQQHAEEAYVNAQKPYYEFYKSEHSTGFPMRAGVSERPLDSTTLCTDQIGDLILQTCRVSAPASFEG